MAKSRNLFGTYEQFAQVNPGLNWVMYFLMWFTVPVEVFFRRNLGQRWFTTVNFYIGLLVLAVVAGMQRTGSLLNQHSLPWKKDNDPYKIWISEIILQQTRVSQGTPYFLRFIEAFPNIKALAAASEDQDLKLWQGLGYYTRARNLHATAKQIVEEYGGIFPNSYSEIIKLKGIGSYTSSAIASFTFEQKHAVVDGYEYLDS